MKTLSEETYVKQAEQVIASLVRTDRQGKPSIFLTSSKIRTLLSLISSIYNDVRLIQEDQLTEDTWAKIQYLRVRFVYEFGRDRDVKQFVENAKIMSCIDEIGQSKKNFLLFSKYMEALVAYHKYYGGRD